MGKSHTAWRERGILPAAALFAVLASIPASAQQAPAPAPAALPGIRDPKAFVNDFLAQVVKTGPDAYDALKSTQLQAAGIDNLKRAAAQQVASIGKAQGVEFISETRLGKTILRLSYILQHERMPEVENFIFYQPPKATAWQLVGVDITVEPARFPFPAAK